MKAPVETMRAARLGFIVQIAAAALGVAGRTIELVA